MACHIDLLYGIGTDGYKITHKLMTLGYTYLNHRLMERAGKGSVRMN